MKNALLIVAAFGFGFLPVIAGAPHITLLSVFVPVLLGLIYFVFWRHKEWPSWGGVPWLFVCALIGQLSAKLWLYSRFDRTKPFFDDFTWTFVAMIGIWYLLTILENLLQAKRNRRAKVI